MKLHHDPVLRDRTVELWASPTARRVVDGTVGRAGHSLSLLGIRSDLSLLALDRDPEAAQLAARRLSGFGARAEAVHASYGDLPELLAERGGPVDGILLDLGVSSPQLDDPARGFSFRADGPLDLRFDRDHGVSAAEWLAGVDERTLTETLRDWGEVPSAHRVARRLLREREDSPLDTTARLRDAVGGSAARHPGEPRDKTLARVFQALRIAVNDELGELDRFLRNLSGMLAPGGRIVILSFHSLEDRAVKRAFQRASTDCVCPPELPVCACGGGHAWLKVITRKPMTASPEEIRRNPRSRSVKLRAAERIPAGGGGEA
ncbi:MAG TPA: 16S rRNA (cytosine(1402)-N(4))-methyltransferase RsmH [bacterium]|nr:16S rRNA (cytosine(1402)-N(4))-methyltransferase RsmH [bacterium]